MTRRDVEAYRVMARPEPDPMTVDADLMGWVSLGLAFTIGLAIGAVLFIAFLALVPL